MSGHSSNCSSTQGQGPPKGDNDIDLITSMAKRLSVLEREMKDKKFLMQRVLRENEAIKAKASLSEVRLPPLLS